MIHSCRNEVREILVTGIASSRCRNVINQLARRIDTVVAGGASSRLHAGMRIGGGHPRCRGVAGAAGCRRLHVGCRLGQRIGADERPVMASLAIGGGYTQ